ncbi:hypothetical protein ACFZCY_44480 [Streptomyces sp. NPDC007983]|uniref:hypothetical protein n=1 Tax=Streptomyces sp. NPDC007983 TaxID=3364800 RepID=UPI0036EB1F79
MGKYLDILAWNPLAAALLADIDTMPPADPHDWEAMAPVVGLPPRRPSGVRHQDHPPPRA